jgi:hypothetical protein
VNSQEFESRCPSGRLTALSKRRARAASMAPHFRTRTDLPHGCLGSSFGHCRHHHDGCTCHLTPVRAPECVGASNRDRSIRRCRAHRFVVSSSCESKAARRFGLWVACEAMHPPPFPPSSGALGIANEVADIVDDTLVVIERPTESRKRREFGPQAPMISNRCYPRHPWCLGENNRWPKCGKRSRHIRRGAGTDTPTPRAGGRP